MVRQTIPTGFGSSRDRWEQALVIGIAVILALLARSSLLPFESGDFTQFTGKWLAAVGEMGPGQFLASNVTNYAPAYNYAMVLAYYLFGWLPPVVSIKMITLPFDFICAWYLAGIVRLRYPSRALWATAFIATLFLPTVLINGAMWGQADVIYTSGIIAFVYYIAREREVAACLALGLAFSVKLQTLFLSPLVLLLLLVGRLHWRYVMLIPTVYIASTIPAWIAGRSLGELLTIYWQQAGYYPRLTSNAAHIYQWFPAHLYDVLLPAGLMWAAGVVGLFTYAVYRSRPRWTADRLVQVATVVMILVPFCTPKMHDRYFFPADVLSLLFAFYFPRMAFVPTVVGLVSVFSYAPFLLGTVIVPIPYLALAMGALLIALLYHLARELSAERGPRPP